MAEGIVMAERKVRLYSWLHPEGPVDGAVETTAPFPPIFVTYKDSLYQHNGNYEGGHAVYCWCCATYAVKEIPCG